ncbi:hypothetical protein [Nocardiopsis sp. JB363]|uniref:hypothetical protein n=1 Tax=Nocardiopsis sp. JB363 TaxID=1434837 RepID=UPI00097A91AD|nr:hypothetical protein [Nocardiopsis sp. JB363]SIO84803.1 hypothetical protein BQ8420_03745 [Nocardiopsis sp. JB363]
MHAIDQQMREMLRTPGVRSVCLVDWRGDRALAHVGEDDGISGAAAMLQAIDGGPLCATQVVEDVVVTEADHHVLFAVLRGSHYCVQVRVERDQGNLGIALRRLRDMADNVEPPEHDTHPPRRGRGRGPRPRALVTVDRPVLERVLTGLRALSVERPRAGTVVA